MNRPLVSTALVASATLAAGLGASGPIRVVIVFTAFALAPGLALLERGGVAATVAISFATACLVCTALLAAGAYSSTAAGLFLAAVCLAGSAWRAIRRGRIRAPVIELRGGST